MSLDGLENHRQKSILFEALSPENAATLRALGRAVHFPGQAQICATGDDDRSMLLIQTGRVEISVTSPEGRRSILAQLGPGDVVGEMAALDGGRRSADAEAAGHVTGLMFSHGQIQGFLQDYPEAAVQVIKTLSARLRKTNTRLATRSLADGPTRLAGLLQQLFDDWGKLDEAGHLRMSEGFSQSDLGDMTGLTRETVNRHIRSWEGAGILSRSPGAMTLLKPAALEALAQGQG